MNLPLTFWCKRFVLQAAVWTLAILAIIGIGVGLIYPTSRWLFADGWQWMPRQKWVTGVLGSVPIGIMIGGLFTLYEWLQHATALLPKKIVISVVVVFFLVVIVMDKGIDGARGFIKWAMKTPDVALVRPAALQSVRLTREAGVGVHSSFVRHGEPLNVGVVGRIAG